MSSNLPKPWKYKDWLIWPNTTLDRMKTNRTGCSDTVNGVCLKNLSIKECMDQSIGNIGYYIKFQNGDSICVPVNKDYDIEYIYKLVNQEEHSKLDGASVSTFLNTNEYKFPPEKANSVFYFDLLQIEHSKTNLIFNSVNTEHDNNYIEFSKDKFTNITLAPIIPSPPDVSSDISILYTKHFFITLPGTRLFLMYDEENNIFRWKTINSDILNFGRKYSFQIYPITLNNIYYKDRLNMGITYQENFVIYYSNKYLLTLDDKNILRATEISLEDLINKPVHNNLNTFRLKSKMIGYYCEDNKCKPVSISDTTIFKDILKKYNLYTNEEIQKIINSSDVKEKLKKMDVNQNIINELKYFDTDSQLKDQVIYKNKIVNINKDCWGMCAYSDGEPNSKIEYSEIEPPFKFINKEYQKADEKNKNKSVNKYILFSIFFIIIGFILFLILGTKYF